MTITSEYLQITAEVEIDGDVETVELAGLLALPRVGDEIEFSYWHGLHFSFIVERVHHHISSVGDKMLQQISLHGKAANAQD